MFVVPSTCVVVGSDLQGRTLGPAVDYKPAITSRSCRVVVIFRAGL